MHRSSEMLLVTCHFATKFAINQDVLSLQIAVEHQGGRGMKKAHSLRNISKDWQNNVSFENHCVVVQDIVQGTILHVFHHEHGLRLLFDNSACKMREKEKPLTDPNCVRTKNSGDTRMP